MPGPASSSSVSDPGSSEGVDSDGVKGSRLRRRRDGVEGAKAVTAVVEMDEISTSV